MPLFEKYYTTIISGLKVSHDFSFILSGSIKPYFSKVNKSIVMTDQMLGCFVNAACDLSQAFGCVHYHIFLDRLQHYPICESNCSGAIF